MYKKFLMLLLIAFFWGLPPAVWAGDGFTQEDRDLIIQLNIKLQELDKRTDQRFTDMRSDMNKRFEQIDNRFGEMRSDMNNRFDEIRSDMGNRFEQIDKRFGETRSDMNNRFGEMRSDMNNRFNNIINLLIGIVASFAGIVAVAISFAIWDRRTMTRPFEDKVNNTPISIL